MQLGIFARTFQRQSLEANLDAIQAHKLRYFQFNMACAGLPSMPDEIDPALSDRIRRAVAARGLTMVSLSGTFNMIDPDPEKRQAGISQLNVLAAECTRLETSLISLCTGSRDPENMWRHHPDNGTPEAWRDLVTVMAEALHLAEAHGVTLGIEPEVSNVVDSASKARRLIDEMKSPHLKVIIDGANLYHKGELPRMSEILDEAFDLLGSDIVMAHAKDLDHDGEAGHLAAGTGLLDYDRYFGLLHKIGFEGPMILHGLTEAQVPDCVAFLQGKQMKFQDNLP